MFSLNENIYETSIEKVIEELEKRDEYHCTGNVCGADACGAHDISL